MITTIFPTTYHSSSSYLSILIIFLSFSLLNGQIEDDKLTHLSQDSLETLYADNLGQKKYKDAAIILEAYIPKVSELSDKLSYINAFIELVEVYRLDGNCSKAIEVSQNNRSELSSLVKNDSVRLLGFNRFLFNYCRSLIRCKKYQEAKNELSIVLSNDSLLLMTKTYEHMLHLEDLLNAQVGMRKYDVALETALQISQLAQNHLGKKHSYYHRSLNMIGIAYKRLGKYKESSDYYLEAINALKANDLSESTTAGVYYSNITDVYMYQNQLDKAEESINYALENAQINYGEKSRRYFSRLNKLASIQKRRGDYQDALLTLYQIYDYYGIIDKQNSSYSLAASAIGLILRDLGRAEMAIPLHQEAVEYTAQKYGLDHNYTAVEYNNLALAQEAAKEFDSAITNYKKAISIEENIRGDSHSNYGLFLHNLSSCYRKIDSIAVAKKLSEQATRHTANIVGKESISYGYRLLNLGIIDLLLENYENAANSFIESMSIFRSSANNNHPEILNSVRNLAIVREMQNNQEAIKLYLEVSDILKEQIASYYPTLSENGRLAYWSTIGNKMNDLLAYSMKTQDDQLVMSSYNLNRATKGLSLNIDKTTSKSKVAKSTELENDLESKKNDLSRAYAESKSEKEISKLEESIRELENRSALGTEKLNFQVDDYFRRTQDLLNKDGIFIDLVYIESQNRKSGINYNGYYSYVVTKDKDIPEMIKMIGQDSLDFLITQVRKNYSKEDIEKAISQSFLQPLEKHLQGKRDVYISLIGAYNLLPLQTLHANPQLDINVQLVTSIEDLIKEGNAIEDIALFGGAEFDILYEQWRDAKYDIDTTFDVDSENLLALLRSEGTERSGRYFGPLPGTAKEIDQIRSILENNQLKHEVWSGNRAIEDNFKNYHTSSPDVIHIASHGFYFEELRGLNIEANTMRESIMLSRNPLFRSGIALTGANLSWSGSETPPYMDDGILTAYEISNMNLSNTKLVVLSACESGLGEIKGREGVFGLQRAFKMAGVNKLIMSLWKVPDQETSELMILFYQDLMKHGNIHKAFKNAQKAMSEKYPPFYWAGFVLVE